MIQLKLSYGTEKISCLMSRHYIDDKMMDEAKKQSELKKEAAI